MVRLYTRVFLINILEDISANMKSKYGQWHEVLVGKTVDSEIGEERRHNRELEEVGSGRNMFSSW